MVLRDLGERLDAVVRRVRRVPLGLEAELQDPHHLRLVVDDEHARQRGRGRGLVLHRGGSYGGSIPSG